MSTNIVNLFNCPVYNSLLKLNNKDLEEHCYLLKKKDEGRILSNKGGWQSNLITTDTILLNNFLKTTLEHIKKYCNLFEIKSSYVPYIHQLWININQYKDFNSHHVHSDSFISGVYYVKSDALISGNIVFYSPNHLLKCMMLNDDWFDNFNEINSIKWEFKPIQDTLYLFPSYLVHEANPNMNKNSDRISIAFNVKLKKINE